MSDEIKPALSAEEWELVLAERWEDLPDSVWDDVGRSTPGCRSGAAAIALLGFFTWEDVDALMASTEGDKRPGESVSEMIRRVSQAVGLAERIASLLPPRPDPGG